MFFFQKKHRASNLLLMLMAVILANINPVFAKLILERGWTPVQMYFVTLLVLAVLLLVFQIVELEHGAKWGMTREDVFGTLLAAIFGGTIGPLFFFEGLQYVTASTSIILTSLLPLFVVIFAVLLLKEHFTRQMIAGGLFLLASLAALLWQDIMQFEISRGIPLIVLSSLSSGYVIIAHKKYVKHRHLDSIVLIRVLMSLVFVGIWMILSKQSDFTFLTTPQNIWLILSMPICSFLIPFFLYFRALSNVTATDAGMIEVMGRVIGITIASSVLGETLGIHHLLSLILTMFGILLINVPLTKWRIAPSRLPVIGPLRK